MRTIKRASRKRGDLTTHLVILILTIAGIASSAEAAREWTVTGQPVPELARVDTMMHDVMTSHDIRNATLAITRDGRLVYARGFTWDEAGRGEPTQPTSLFRTASIAKSFTSVAIHQLIERGLLRYDTRVTSILDLRPPPGKKKDPWLDQVTVDHLLTHTGGWDRDAGATYFDPMVYQDQTIAQALGVSSPPTQAEIATFMTGRKLDFQPGSDWAYSNYGYVLLGMIIEKITGQSYAEYVLENVFRPVGAGRPRPARNREEEAAPTEVHYYCQSTGLGCQNGDPYAFNFENAIAAGGWAVAAPDIARLYSALFDSGNGGGLLNRESLEAMLAPVRVLGANGYGRGWLSEEWLLWNGYRLGWLTDWFDGHRIVGHGGGAPGTQNFALWRSDGIVVVLMTNKDPLVMTLDFPEITSWPDHDLWDSVGIVDGRAGSASTEAWIPAVAHGNGAEGSAWRSDINLLNRSLLRNQVRLRLDTGNAYRDMNLTLEPKESRAIDDIAGVLELDGLAPLRIVSSEPLSVGSRTFNQTSRGTFGQALEPSPSVPMLDKGSSGVLMQLREDDSFRTNIGLVNTWTRTARVEIRLFEASGTEVAKLERSVPAHGNLQLNQPFRAQGGRTNVASGYATVRVLEGLGIITYASVVDNATSDPTSIPLRSGSGDRTQWVAGAAHDVGAGSSKWRTDLALLNTSGARRTVEVDVLDRGVRIGSLNLGLDNGEQTNVVDVLAAAGVSGSGAIRVSADGPVLVGSRTYNAGDSGTFGQAIGGIAPERGARAGDTVWLPGLRQNDSFRTNIGLVNVGEASLRLAIRLFDQAGDEVAAWSEELAAGERQQRNQPFLTVAGRTDLDIGAASVTVESGDGALIVYGSVVDNRTHDPTTIAMRF